MTRVIIDVREPNEYITNHASGAINIPLSDVPTEIPRRFPDNDTEIILYCNSGNRSGMAIQLLQALGYTNLTNGINQQNVDKA